MIIKYVKSNVDDSQIAELFDDRDRLLLRVYAHKMSVYANREDDWLDPNVPYTLTTEYQKSLCWSNAVDLRTLKSFYYEMVANLCNYKILGWRMMFYSSTIQEVYDEFLELSQRYTQENPNILLFVKEDAENILSGCPRFVERFVQGTKWNKCIVGVKSEFINEYKTNWPIEGKLLK